MYMKFINFRWSQLIMGRNYVLCCIICKILTALLLVHFILSLDIVSQRSFLRVFAKINDFLLIYVGENQCAAYLQQSTSTPIYL